MRSPRALAAFFLPILTIAFLSFGLDRVYADPPPNDLGATVSPVVSADTASLPELLKEVTTLRSALAHEKESGDKTEVYLGIAGLAAVLLKFLLDFLKSLKTDELSDKAKRAMPWLLSGLGVLVAVLVKYAAGQSWVNAIILGGSAPGAVLAHELIDALRGALKKKPAIAQPDGGK